MKTTKAPSAGNRKALYGPRWINMAWKISLKYHEFFGYKPRKMFNEDVPPEHLRQTWHHQNWQLKSWKDMAQHNTFNDAFESYIIITLKTGTENSLLFVTSYWPKPNKHDRCEKRIIYLNLWTNWAWNHKKNLFANMTRRTENSTHYY